MQMLLFTVPAPLLTNVRAAIRPDRAPFWLTALFVCHLPSCLFGNANVGGESVFAECERCLLCEMGGKGDDA